MTRVGRTALILAVVMGGAAYGQWNLNWFADPFVNPADGLLVDNTVTPIAEGNPIYLLYDGGDGIDGIDSYGYILGNDRVVVYQATGNAVRATVGDVDWVFPPNTQGPGEFNETANGIESALETGALLYAIAFIMLSLFRESACLPKPPSGPA